MAIPRWGHPSEPAGRHMHMKVILCKQRLIQFEFIEAGLNQRKAACALSFITSPI